MKFFNVLAMVVLVALSAFLCEAGNFNPNDLGKFNDFVKTPHSDSPTATAASETIHTGGRLIERHLQYLAEAGYKSVLSVVQFATNDTVYNGVAGNFPASDYEMQLLSSYGLQGKYLASSFTVESATAISQIMDEMPKPLYVHCHVGYTANVFTQLHFYMNKQITSDEIYSHSLNMGYDLQNNTDVVNLINAVAGRSDTTQPEQIEQTLAQGEYSYKYYYWTHRLGNNDYYYNAGQILSTHIDSIKTAGYQSVVVFRQNGEPTARLPTDPSTGKIDNHEFSDENGNYDVTLEHAAVKDAGLHFYYLPLVSGGDSTWTKATFDKYTPVLKLAATHGPVLVHCASGYRSSSFTLIYLAAENKQCSSWVVEKARQIGFDLNSATPSTSDQQILALAKEVLGC